MLVFGYGEVGVRCLERLAARGVRPVGAFTHRDAPGEAIWFRSVADLAADLGIPVFTPDRLADPEWHDAIADRLRPDLILSFYYRRMIPMRLLALARLGALNMHGSYLPRYRGRAPVNWAVLHGERTTGVTLHHMVAEPDAGDIVDQEPIPIGGRDTAAQVMARVADTAVAILDRQLDALLAGTAPRRPQDHARATYFGRRTPEDGRIDWARPAPEIFNLIRAVTRPYPGAFADFADGRRLIVWWAEPVPGEPAPGRILGEEPLVIGTGQGHLAVTDFEWVPAGRGDR